MVVFARRIAAYGFDTRASPKRTWIWQTEPCIARLIAICSTPTRKP